jgi:hypothetical protein
MGIRFVIEIRCHGVDLGQLDRPFSTADGMAPVNAVSSPRQRKTR